MKCAIYTRVSTDNQAEKEYNSCEAQEERIKSYIKSQEELKLYQVYSDPGYSGANIERPALGRMLKDIIDGKIDCVLCYKIDRLTRSPKDFYALIELFDSNGVSFISITEHFDTATPSGRLLRNIMLTFAQFERELSAERTKDKMYQRAEKGMWNGGTVPYGYKNKDKKLVINPEESEFVKEMFKIFIETKSLAETRRRINKKYKTRKGKKFSKTTVDNILRNPVYYGKLPYKENLYDGVHKPIITEPMFLKAQSFHKKRYKRKTKIDHVYFLQGLLKCSECGSTMTPTYTKNKHKDGITPRYTKYYRCTKTYKHEWDSCNIKSVNADKIEDFVIYKLKEISKDEKAINKIVERTNKNDELKISPLKKQEKEKIDELRVVGSKLQNLIDILSEVGIERFPSVRKEIENLENKKKVLEFDLEGIKLSIQKEEKEKFETKIVLENLKDFSKKIGEISPKDRPQLFQSLIKSISYGLDEVSLDIFYLPEGYIRGLGNHRAYSAGRADVVGEDSAEGRSTSKRGRRAPSGEADEHGLGGRWSAGGNWCSKNRKEWLGCRDSNPDSRIQSPVPCH